MTWAVVVAAAVAATQAGCHPTGTPVLDPLYAAAAAAVATAAAAQARRATLLWLTALSVVMSRDLLLVPAGCSLLVAFGSTLPRRRQPLAGAVAGAVAVNVALRWPSIGFQGLTALVAVVAVVPVLVSAYRQQRRRVRHGVLYGLGAGVVLVVVLSVPVAVGALLSRSAVSSGITETTGALSALGGSSGATARLGRAETDFSTAATRTGSWWSAGGRLIPVVAQQRQALARSTATAHQLTAVAAQQTAQLDPKGFEAADGQIDLARLRALRSPLAALKAQVIRSQTVMRSTRSAWLVGPLQSRLTKLDTELTNAQSATTLGLQAVADAPGLLGADGTRHYFVAFMNPAESRGLDGLIGAYAELTVDNGRITLSRSGHTSDLNDVPDGTRKITGPADYLARYGAFDPADHFQDLTYSPDFPTVAQVIAEMYPQSGGGPINGVLALDPEALASLLEVTGPITVAGSPHKLTAANATEFLVEQEYIDYPASNEQGTRHDFLEEAVATAFTRLTSGHLTDPVALVHDLGPAVSEGRLSFWSFDKADQPLLRKTGLAGAFPRADGSDLLSLTTQNADNNKIDAYLQRTIDDDVTYDPGTGQVEATVTVTLHNEAPASGLPPEVIGSYAGSGIPSGTNRTWLSLYSPLGVAKATEGGARISVTATRELGVDAYSTYVNVPAGATVTLSFQLRGQIRPGPSYTLHLHQQPMVHSDHDIVRVTPVSRWSNAPESSPIWKPTGAANQTHTVKFSPPTA